jgi:hypothetical protein
MDRCAKILPSIVIGLSACGGPSAPTSCTDALGRGQTALNFLTLECATVGTMLNCQSTASISGLYVYCPRSEDVTTLAEWTVGDPAVLKVTAPGVFAATGVGQTFVRATWHGIDGGMRPVAVYPSTPPLPTGELDGTVYEEGQTIAAGAIDGASVEILDGLVAGQKVLSGVPPPLPPGFLGPFGGRGYYRLVGVPPGKYSARISKDGFVPQERTFTITGNGARILDIPLRRS